MRLIVVLLLCLESLSALASFDDLARYAFLSSRSDKAVIVIDLYDRNKAGEIVLNEAPDSVTASEALKAAIVSHRDAHMLTLIDLTAEVPAQIDYPLDIRPDIVVVSPIGETVAILDQERGELQIHAVKLKKILVTVNDVNTTSALTFNPDGSTIYWVDGEASMLHAVDLWSKHRKLRLPGAGAGLSALTRSIDGTLGFVSNANDGAVHVVGLRTFSLVRSNRIGRQPERAWGTADGQYMLVPDADAGTVTAMSAATGEPLYTVKAVMNPVSINPGWIDTIAAVVARSGEVVFLSIDSGSELGRVTLDSAAEQGVVTSDSKTLAVPVPGRGSVALFDLRKRELVATIAGLPNDIGPAALAVSNNLCH